MNKKKTIITAAVLLAVLLVGGLLAYFQDTDTKTNVFTLGNVNIQLNEAGWTQDGQTSNYTRNEAANITPNKTIAKAPTVKNIGNDETGNGNGNDAYVFLKVQVPQANIAVGDAAASTQDIYTLDNVDTTHWQEITVSGVTGNGVHVYVYGTGTTEATMSKLTYNTSTPALMDSVTLKNVQDPASFGNNFNITVTAYGIQADDLDLTEATGATEAAKIFSLFN